MMDPDRRAALTAGTLFIAATASSLLSSAVEHPVLTGTGYLARLAADPGRAFAGGLLELLAAGTSAGIAVALYPVLRKHSEGLALGAVVFRALEAAMYAAGAVITLALPAVARQHAQATAPGRGGIQATGDALTSVRQDAILAGVLAFIAGALLYYCVLYRSRLIPRWLSGWGIAAEIPLLIACLSAVSGRTPVTSHTILIIPIAVQEMVLALWLISRGFSRSAVQAGPDTWRQPGVPDAAAPWPEPPAPSSPGCSRSTSTNPAPAWSAPIRQRARATSAVAVRIPPATAARHPGPRRRPPS